jgi:hypothetical protein
VPKRRATSHAGRNHTRTQYILRHHKAKILSNDLVFSWDKLKDSVHRKIDPGTSRIRLIAVKCGNSFKSRRFSSRGAMQIRKRKTSNYSVDERNFGRDKDRFSRLTATGAHASRHSGNYFSDRRRMDNRGG